MMPKYAEKTEVTVEASRMEIEHLLKKYGAINFISAIAEDKAMFGFTMCDRQVKFVIPLPELSNFKYSPQRQNRNLKAQKAAQEQAHRQRWRILKLVIQSKLEAIECKISTFEDEFLANIVLPDGTTTGDFMRPQIKNAYLTCKMPQPLKMLGLM
jgi:hypothetical protein